MKINKRYSVNEEFIPNVGDDDDNPYIIPPVGRPNPFIVPFVLPPALPPLTPGGDPTPININPLDDPGGPFTDPFIPRIPLPFLPGGAPIGIPALPGPYSVDPDNDNEPGLAGRDYPPEWWNDPDLFPRPDDWPPMLPWPPEWPEDPDGEPPWWWPKPEGDPPTYPAGWEWPPQLDPRLPPYLIPDDFPPVPEPPPWWKRILRDLDPFKLIPSLHRQDVFDDQVEVDPSDIYSDMPGGMGGPGAPVMPGGGQGSGAPEGEMVGKMRLNRRNMRRSEEEDTGEKGGGGGDTPPIFSDPVNPFGPIPGGVKPANPMAPYPPENPTGIPYNPFDPEHTDPDGDWDGDGEPNAPDDWHPDYRGPLTVRPPIGFPDLLPDDIKPFLIPNRRPFGKGGPKIPGSGPNPIIPLIPDLIPNLPQLPDEIPLEPYGLPPYPIIPGVKDYPFNVPIPNIFDNDDDDKPYLPPSIFEPDPYPPPLVDPNAPPIEDDDDDEPSGPFGMEAELARRAAQFMSRQNKNGMMRGGY